ncbi:DNA-directed RNA polymerase subunit alpha C-terminal domain-containing protein [Paenibacillus sp. BR2-3]|uniref:DNA-directed RNA polymerase subunit alpha C-terminal domain-containing protein n=1 Tax=Paenibacillus sp. BR2-3 TaxID=3048494 RepID=UPI00397753C5
MKNAMLPNVPLKFYVPVAIVFYPFPIHYLRIATVDTYRKSVSRILNSLQENEYRTISDVLNASLEDLGKARNFGERGKSLLLELLQKICDQPDLVLETGKLEHKLREEVERITRKEPIRKQLYDMGLIK